MMKLLLHSLKALTGFLLVFGALVLPDAALVAGQATATPAALTCMVGVEIQPLAQGMPSDTGGRALIVARLTIAPDGGFDVHTHPGMLTVTVDSGSLAFTQTDHGSMTLNRADATTEPIAQNKEVILDAGDWLVESEGMLHMAWNRTDEPTVVILSGLVDPTQPLVQCAE